MTTDIVNIQVADRKVYRKLLVAFLKRSMNTPKTVLPYLPTVTKLQSPMVSVTGGPTDRQRDTPKAYNNMFGFSIHLTTWYSSSKDNWTPENAEDMLDTLEHELAIALLLADMQSASNGWRSISRQGLSTFDILDDSGRLWLTEKVAVVMEIDDEQE